MKYGPITDPVAAVFERREEIEWESAFEAEAAPPPERPAPVPENAITVIGEGARPSSTNAWSDERRGTDQHADRLPVRYIGDTSATLGGRS